ncbi:hypothetical protein H6F95_05460 [Cyanobacteria bacterium FACHB-471]|nr:hypothetical protein [Cyanobacteria bacterium FACHB-471]
MKSSTKTHIFELRLVKPKLILSKQFIKEKEKMAQIKVLDLDNACSLSELSGEDMNIVKGGFATVLALTKVSFLAQAAYWTTLTRTGSVALAWAASLSTPA